MNDKYFSLGSSANNYLGKKTKSNNYDYNEKEYNIDLKKKDNTYSAIIRQIKQSSEVLDVGCASGIIGQILNKRKNCVVDGIDFDKEALKVAKSKNVYRDIFCFSISDEKSVQYKKFLDLKRKYDYIVFADVLEHLVNPWEVIFNFSKLLKTNGSLIISIPNIAHIDIIKALINNEFNYYERGLLDSTHLRFFTENSFVDMIKNIEEENNVKLNVELCEKIHSIPSYILLNDEYKKLAKEIDYDDYLVLQNIFKISVINKDKNAIKPKKHIDNFGKLIKKYNNLISLDKDQKAKIKLLESEQQRLEKEVSELHDSLNKIYESKRWKMMNKLLKIIKK